MPIFEYHCQNCNEDFEELVSGVNPEVSCPKCNSYNVQKRFSLFGMSGVEKQVLSGCSSCTKSTCTSCSK